MPTLNEIFNKRKIILYLTWQTGGTNQYSSLDISLTFLSLHYPRNLMRHLKKERKLTVEKISLGVYYINKETFNTQIIVVKELSPEDNLYLRCLTNELQDTELAKKLDDDYKQHQEQDIYIRYMNQIIIANTKKEDAEYYQPKIDYLKSLLIENNIPFNLEMEDQEHSEFVESNKKVVKGRFKHLNGEKVLDLGCGYGFYTDYFRSIGANVIGVDGSEKMIEIARDQYPSTEFSVMDITMPLPFENNQFDVVFSNQVLMDIENIEFVFSECKRILKTGGILYYSIVHPAFYDGYWLKDSNGYKHAKVIYINVAAKNGFVLRQTCEPVSYDGINKNSDLPLFFFAEYTV